MERECIGFTMQVKITQFEHPRLYHHLRSITNAKLRSREIKRLANEMLQGISVTPINVTPPLPPMEVKRIPPARTPEKPNSSKKSIEPF